MIEKDSQLTKLESTALYPRLVLLEVLAGFKDKPKQRARSNDPICEARRDFLDSFAYLCDVKKGGGTVTAAALQKLEKSDFLWLAANEGIRDEILTYAYTILDAAKSATVESLHTAQTHILALNIKKCKPRIQFYKDAVRTYAHKCRMALKKVERNDVIDLLRTTLKKLHDPPSSMNLEAYVDLCFDMRSEDIKAIKSHSKTAADDFSKLAHYIYRIGATREAANKVIEAMILVPSLQRISTIQRVDAPGVKEKTIRPTCMSPHEVLYAVLSDTKSHDPLKFEQAFLRLYQLDSPSDRPIHKLMASKKEIKTRVHAELQIADKFARSQDISFVDSDKYIGCSKPACYFCYTWLCNHNHRYVEPATHHKIIPGCRGPDHELNDAGMAVLIAMYAKISRQVGQDIFSFLEKDAPQPRVQYMSTEAGSRAPSRLSGV